MFALLAGCAGTPPSRVESMFLDTRTNYVDVPVLKTNQVTITNYQTEVVQHTNVTTDHQIIVTTLTNIIPVFVPSNYTVWQTQQMVAGYDYAPKTNVVSGIQTVGGIAGSFTPWGSFVGGALVSLLGLYAKLRSSNKAIGSLAQGIETAREILVTMPNGQQYDDAYVKWLQDHQKEIGVFRALLPVIENVDNPAAQTVAREIRDVLATQTAGTTSTKV